MSRFKAECRDGRWLVWDTVDDEVETFVLFGQSDAEEHAQWLNARGEPVDKSHRERR